MRKNLLVILIIQIFGMIAFASGTVVGNGGDPVFDFMEAVRSSMIETIKTIVNSPEEQKTFCQASNLNSDQIQFCQSFFLTVADDILRLNQGTNRTPFVLREDPLTVEGPDGKPMIVAARTQLGAVGPVELHRDSVKTMLPTQALFLVTHEFQHKANYLGRNMTDNEKIGPFASGRDLIDAVAASVVNIAKKKGKIGTQFGIRDIFDCRVTTGDSQFGARLSSSRLFAGEDLMSYQTSIGKNLNDGSIFIPDGPSSMIMLRFLIEEPNNCGDLNPNRKTILQIVRSQNNFVLKDDILASLEFSENPMCPQTLFPIEISSSGIKFSCHYYGSEGTTSSQFALGKSRFF